jgi:NAD(P)-dependent dehydrogenase (short-subunit alcohol dehydrogenase family)
MGIYACTGSNSGIGSALLFALREEGHGVITVDIGDANVLADLSSSHGRQRAIDGILKLAPQGLDGFIPVAGLGRGLATSELITSVNYFGTVDLVEGLRSALCKKKGRVVLLGSNSASMPQDRPEYMAALRAGDETKALRESKNLKDAVCYMLGKRALMFWMQRNVMAYGREGIRINAVAPGPVFTPMTASLLKQEEYASMMETMLNATPLKRVGRPDEVAKSILFLLDPQVGYVCGSVLYVDGGFNAHARQNEI